MIDNQTILVIQHSKNVPIGSLGEFFREKGIKWTYIKLYEGESLPSVTSEYLAVVSLGGIMGAYDVEEFPWLATEKEWLVENVKVNKPVLGICLGCQLLADALGGKAYKGPKIEVGFPDIKLTNQGIYDPVMSKFQNPVLVSHGDTWDLPPGGTLLAENDVYRHAFRFGSALGVQFHPEATYEQAKEWFPLMKLHASRDRVPFENGEFPLDDLLNESQTKCELATAAAFKLFDAWLENDVLKK